MKCMKFRLTYFLFGLLALCALPLMAEEAKIPQEYRILSIPSDWTCPPAGQLTPKMMETLTSSKDAELLHKRQVAGDAATTSNLQFGERVVYLQAKKKVFVRKTSEEVDGFKLEATIFPGTNGVYLLQCVLHQFDFIERHSLKGLDLPVGRPIFSTKQAAANLAVQDGAWNLLYDQGLVKRGEQRIILLARVGEAPKVEKPEAKKSESSSIKFKLPKPLDISSLHASHDTESKTSQFMGNARVDLGLFQLHTEALNLYYDLPLRTKVTENSADQELTLIPLTWDKQNARLTAKNIQVKRGNAQLNASEGTLFFGTK